jgi:hypothetical protein
MYYLRTHINIKHMKKLFFFLLLVITTKVNSQITDTTDILVYEIDNRTIKAERVCFIEDEVIVDSVLDYHIKTVILVYSNYINTKPDSVSFLTDTGYVSYLITGEVIRNYESSTYQFNVPISSVDYTGSIIITNDQIKVVIPNNESLIKWESKIKVKD